MINKAPATINLSNLIQTYDGTPKSATATTDPAGLGVVTITYDGSATAPTNAGSYAVAANLDNANYTAPEATGTLVINKAPATINLSNLIQTYDGTPKSATATTDPAGLGVVTITYDGSTTAPTNAGSYAVAANLDNANYTAPEATGTLVINKAPATINLSNLIQTYDGTPKSATATTDPAGLGVVTITYDGSTTAPTNAGSYAVAANLDNANYTAPEATGTLVINKASLSVKPTQQTVQYSDYLPSLSVDDLNIIGFVNGEDRNVLDESALSFAPSGQITYSAGNYQISCTGFSATNYDFNYEFGTLIIAQEDAAIDYDSNNPVAVNLQDGAFSLVVYVQEISPEPTGCPSGNCPGDIEHADVTITLTPIGPGTQIVLNNTVSPVREKSGSGYETLKVTFGPISPFSIAPNVYSVEVAVDNEYYHAAPVDDVLGIYDPADGFTTGGGWFYWPGSGEKTNFGYNMKYNRKRTNVQGNLLLIRHMADGSIYRVKSNMLDALTLGSTDDFGWAIFSGKSTYFDPTYMTEPAGGYRFMVYVEDRDEPGTGIDRFWIDVAGEAI